MAGHSTYQPTERASRKWLETRLPIIGLVHSSFVVYPTPRNLNYWWTFGAILTFMLVAQIVTGVVLAMHYTPDGDARLQFGRDIMRDVNYGWLLRYLHANGASLFFFAVYIHIFRGLYYGSYKEPREVLWILGVIIFLLMMATAFMGYVLPWGQMSFWAATVITNLFSAIPLVGEAITHMAVGRLRGRQPDAQPLLLAALPAAVHDRRRGRPAHLGAARAGQQQSDRHRRQERSRTRCRSIPYYTIKDIFGLVVFLILLAWLVFFVPNYLGHPDNYIPANPLKTPAHIVPEWYFLPFYAILRAIPNKLLGVIALFALDRDPRLRAVARYVAGALGDLPADLPPVLLDLRARLHRPRLSRLAAAGRRLRDRRAHPHRLLLPALPDHPAGRRPDRAAEAAADQHHRSGARQDRGAARGGEA